MASIIREVVIQAPAAPCRDAVRAFGALQQRLACGFVTAVTMHGERDRRVTFFTGAVAMERPIGIDEQSRRLAYARAPAAPSCRGRHRGGEDSYVGAAALAYRVTRVTP